MIQSREEGENSHCASRNLEPAGEFLLTLEPMLSKPLAYGLIVDLQYSVCHDDGEDEYSETIFYKDGTARIVNINEIFVWNQQLFDATH